MMLDKEELHKTIEDAQKGNREAFAALYLYYNKMIYSIGWKAFGTHADAEDVVQESFYRLMLKIRLYKNKAAFNTFFWRLATNVAYAMFRRAKGFSDRVPLELLGEGVLHSGEDHEDELERRELGEEALKLVPKLPAIERSIATMFFLQGKTQRQIHKLNGMPLGTVKRRVGMAKIKLKNLALINRLFGPEDKAVLLCECCGRPREFEGKKRCNLCVKRDSSYRKIRSKKVKICLLSAKSKV